MGHESNERGSGVAVAVVIVVLLGFFILLCVGSGLVVFLFGARNAVPMGTVRTARAVPAPATLSPAYSVQPVEESGETAPMPVAIDAEGTIRISGEVVPLDQVEVHLRRTSGRDGGQTYLFLDVKVSAECRVAPLVEFLNRVRQLGFCDVEISLADPSADTPNN